MAKGGSSRFLVTTVFASFFGAALIAGAFAYFNYKFSEYKFIDFSRFVFYKAEDIFRPDQERYVVIFFSSKIPESAKKIASLELEWPVLAIDYYNSKIKSTKGCIFLRSGTETMLRFIQRFNIYAVPTLFLIKRVDATRYKQDSALREFDSLESVVEHKNIIKEL